MELILQTERFSVYFVLVASLLNRMRMRIRKNIKFIETKQKLCIQRIATFE